MPIVENCYRAWNQNWRAQYGLGDFLTQDINYRKAGAMIGTLAPAALTFGYFSLATKDAPYGAAVAGITTVGLAIAAPVQAIAITMTGGLIGYWIGKDIDYKLGDRTMRHPWPMFPTEDPEKKHIKDGVITLFPKE
jgi:hypothetical protein